MTGVVFFNLRRTFEVVDRNILMKELGWLWNKRDLNNSKIYLENRTQKVKFNGIKTY